MRRIPRETWVLVADGSSARLFRNLGSGNGAVKLHQEETLVLDPRHYEGPGDGRVDPPVPLGRMGRKLVEIVTMPVEKRPVDLYAALAEVAR